MQTLCIYTTLRAPPLAGVDTNLLNANSASSANSECNQKTLQAVSASMQVVQTVC